MSRLQINVTDQQLSDLEVLIAKCGIGTKKELFNNALVLLDWAVREREKGNIIASINEKTAQYRELVMPVVNNVAVVAEEAAEQREVAVAE